MLSVSQTLYSNYGVTYGGGFDRLYVGSTCLQASIMEKGLDIFTTIQLRKLGFKYGIQYKRSTQT